MADPEPCDEAAPAGPSFRGPYGVILPDPVLVAPEDRLKYGNGPLGYWPDE